MALSDKLIQQVWEKARGTFDQDSATWRQDECGAWIKREHYGNEQSEYGWKVENVSTGGPDVLENLRAFHHQNSFDRANAKATCHVTADRTGLEPSERISQPRNRSV